MAYHNEIQIMDFEAHSMTPRQMLNIACGALSNLKQGTYLLSQPPVLLLAIL